MRSVPRDHRAVTFELLGRDDARVEITRVLGAGGVEDSIVVVAPVATPVHVELAWDFDFADVFEVRGLERVKERVVHVAANGSAAAGEPGGISARYRNGAFMRGVDVTIERSTSPADCARGRIAFEVRLDADGDAWEALVAWRPRFPPDAPGRATARGPELPAEAVAPVEIRVADAVIQRVVERALDDLRSLRLPVGRGGDARVVAAAGVPWYVALFGRDSLIVGMDAIWCVPEYLRGALRELAELQSTSDDPERDAEPGKIPHERRRGELAALGLSPWNPYFGSHDSTSLFVIAAAEAYAWTGDRDQLTAIRSALEAAAVWIDRYGDRDGDGLQEYRTRSRRGFPQHGWKDSRDGIVDERGNAPPAPIALCEHQALAYAAMRSLASLYESGGHPERARPLRESAARLRDRFNEAFWWEAEGTYVLGLDGEKRQLRAVASNAGQCLASGIVPADRAARVAERLMVDDMFSGWGVRTLSAAHPAFDPNSYHRGSVWPHDNAAIATGLRRTGHRREAAAVAEGIFASAAARPQSRIPELISGDARSIGPPTRPPKANAPQAWAASAVLRLITVLCGVQAAAPTGKLYADPALPAWLPEIEIRNLRAGSGSADIRFRANEIDVLNNTTGLEIVHGPAQGGPM